MCARVRARVPVFARASWMVFLCRVRVCVIANGYASVSTKCPQTYGTVGVCRVYVGVCVCVCVCVSVCVCVCVRVGVSSPNQ